MAALPALPKEVQQVIDIVEEAGGRAYLVGGALRDLMLGRRPFDWDFAATLPPERLLPLFEGAELTGGVYGTVQVPCCKGNFEITPCRAESAYSDNRHPDRVTFLPDILADLARRDFTINAMAYDGRVLFDPFGGQMDLKKRLLRCVGNAKERFEEDALRILRLFRLAGKLGFIAEWNTFLAANQTAERIATLPRERVLDELLRILTGPAPHMLCGLIASGGLKPYGLQFAPAMLGLCRVPTNFLCRLWALCALCGADTNVVAEAFGLARRSAASMAEYTRLYRMGPALDKVKLKRKMASTRVNYALLARTFAAVSPAYSGEPALLMEVRAQDEPYTLRQLAINGNALRAEGIEGKACGRILNKLLDAVIQNPALNKPAVLLGLARGMKQLP